MSRFAYVNGRFCPMNNAQIHIEDRGFQFADGIYEVIALVKGCWVDGEAHLDRLERSLASIQLPLPLPRSAFKGIIHRLVRLNRVQDGMVYMQITRGSYPRQFHFPPHDILPTLVMTVCAYDFQLAMAQNPQGVKAITTPDLRWKRCDIKSVALLPSVLAKQDAVEHGAFESILVDDEGWVTEGSSSNIWIITAQGILQTHPLNHKILPGITRERILELAHSNGFSIQEKPFTRQELYQAHEVFLSSATKFITPIIEVDGHAIHQGQPGHLTTRLRQFYQEHVKGVYHES